MVPISREIKGFVAGLFISAATLLSPSHSGAMEIKQYDLMSPQDRANYATMLWEKSARSFLEKKDISRKDLEEAKKIRILFSRDNGAVQFEIILNQLRVANPLIEVEEAMNLVFAKNNIDVSVEKLKQFAKDFKPSDKQYADEEPLDGKPRAAVTTPDEFKVARN